jgi:hypothetical protein
LIRDLRSVVALHAQPATFGHALIGGNVNTDFAKAPAWRNLVWIGVIGSVAAWAIAWFFTRGPSPVNPSLMMLFVAIAAVALLYRANRGTRVAWVGLVGAGVVLLLGSILNTGLLFVAGALPAGQVSFVDWLFVSVLPMATAVALLMGAGLAYRNAQPAAS